MSAVVARLAMVAAREGEPTPDDLARRYGLASLRDDDVVDYEGQAIEKVVQGWRRRDASLSEADRFRALAELGWNNGYARLWMVPVANNHLPGKHDQKSHGRRKKAAPPKKAAAPADPEGGKAAEPVGIVMGGPGEVARLATDTRAPFRLDPRDLDLQATKKVALAGGVMADTELVTLPRGGGTVVTKTYTSGREAATREVETEHLVASLGQALGARVPRTYLPDEPPQGNRGTRTVVMEYLAGHQPALKATAERRDAALASTDGRRLALLDALTGNTDRHRLNWMIDKGGKPSGIDHGLAYSSAHRHADPTSAGLSEYLGVVARKPGSPAHHWLTDPATGRLSRPISDADLAETWRRVFAMAPAYDDLGRQDWHARTRRALDYIGSLPPRTGLDALPSIYAEDAP